jgi:hypothetical protein
MDWVVAVAFVIAVALVLYTLFTDRLPEPDKE